MILKKLGLYALGLLGFAASAQNFKYGDALQHSFFFYEAQQSGKLPSWNRVNWRADSTLDDGKDVGKDLSGGWFDAGDHVKFNFPMAYSVTTLAWGGIEFEDAYRKSGQLDILKRNLRFVTDYFLKCHTGPTELYGQVAAGGVDHGWWGSPEVYPLARQSFKITASAPGSDLAAETASAMAAVSILLKKDDPAYSARLIKSAKELYEFADKYRGEYSASITDAAGFYRSFSSYKDEIVWGATWLYRATGEAKYLAKAEAEYDNMQKEGQSTTAKYKEAFSWDDKGYGSYVLLAQLTGKDKYKTDAERNLDWWTGVGVNGEVVPTTPGGLPHIRQWGTLRYANNEGFLAYVYASKVATTPAKVAAYKKYGKFIVDYTLGKNPINRSFMCGFGNNPANDPHHRANSGNWTNSGQGPPEKASHILYGAVVGGPKSPGSDDFTDERNEFVANEVATDYNAGVTGLLAALYGEFGGEPSANFPVKEKPSRAEVRSFSKFNSNNNSGSTISVNIQNRTAWPARRTDKLSYRYYFDISEGIAAGKTIADYNISINGIGGSAKLAVKPAGGSLYYAEVTDLPAIAPTGDPAFRTESQINIRVGNGVPYNTANDFSANGINGSSAAESVNIPVYDNGKLVFGNVPGGATTPIDPVNTAPVASFTVDKNSGQAPLAVSFDSSASSDTEDDDLTYLWNFGNGQTSTVASPSTIYTTPGSYLVSLTVNDGKENSTATTTTIAVNAAPVAVDGGTITGGPFTFTVGDGIADNVSNITLTGNTGKNSGWIVTDESLKILGLPATPEAVNFDGAGVGVCLIWHISYEDGISGLTKDANAANLTGNYDLSNSIRVNRNAKPVDPVNPNPNPVAVNGGTITGGPFTFTVNDGIADNVSGVSLTGNKGEKSQWIVTNASGIILGLPAAIEVVNFDTAAPGICNIFNVSYSGTITGLEVGKDVLADLKGNLDLSNSITVNRNASSVSPTLPTDGDCKFGTPVTAPLATINASFANIFVLGTGGPNLDNVRDFTINWDLSNNGLYQFSMNTTNGTPAWWNNFLPKVTQNFNSAQPSVTIAGSGFAGFDGDYYASIDSGNFVLVSKAGGFTIYFSTSTTAPNCEGTTPVDSTPVAVDGGTLTGGPFTFTVGDGIADNVSGVTLTGNKGKNSGYIVTDEALKILGLPGSPEAVNFEEAGTGVCLIWHISYEDGLTGLTKDANAGDLKGTFDLSNSITVNRNAAVVNPPVVAIDGGTLTGGPFTFTVGDGIADNVSGVTLTGNTGKNSGYIVTDEALKILGLPGSPEAVNFDGAGVGVCLIWHISYEDGLTGLTKDTNAGDLKGTFDLSNSITVNRNAAVVNPPVVVVDGATVSTSDDKNSVVTITGDGKADLITFKNASTATANYAYLITDESGRILVSETASHDFEGSTVGICLVYGISYEGSLSFSGKSIKDTGLATGNFKVSTNSITVDRKEDAVVVTPSPTTPSGKNEYIDRFTEMRNEFYDPANGYFSKDGSPHHSVEALIVEAPDHGHESTSELYSYWLMLEAMQGRVTKDWQPLAKVWSEMERMIIPTKADQPTNAAYNASKPAAYASEFPQPNQYPSPLNFNAAVGQDPVSAELSAAYGPEVYQMHWLLDNDNFYGYGNRGDGVSTPSYINTFQRGEQESVYETVPHPSWEAFNFGNNATGFLPIFIQDSNYAKQWRYTSAPDADARAVQAMYWAIQYAKEQGGQIDPTLLDNTKKMGDYLRISMFDKYFKKIGSQDEQGSAGNGYDSAHYLMSWYTSWGGSADPASAWAFRISSSHCHFGYQNPVAAYALTTLDELDLKTPNGERDWKTSLQRQMEFYRYLQSADGAIAGGATNSWNGNYSKYPAGKSTFYGMAYDKDPVYHDPGSGTWFGWQAWSVERVAEYYYITNDPLAKEIIDKWAAWAVANVKLIGDDDFQIPATLEWTGEPDNWDAANPGANANLRVKITDFSRDLGIAASLAKTLTYYAAGTQKHATLNTAAKNMAKEILDRMWNKYRDDKGVGAPETRGDYKRIFEEVVHIPSNYTGKMANGDEIKTGATFLDLRSGLKNDPEFPKVEAAYKAGTDYTTTYHRSWAQIEVALANAEYGFFFGDDKSAKAGLKDLGLGLTVSPNPASEVATVTYKAVDGVTLNMSLVNLTGQVLDSKIVSDGSPVDFDVENLASGMYLIRVTTNENKVQVLKLVVN